MSHPDCLIRGALSSTLVNELRKKKLSYLALSLGCWIRILIYSYHLESRWLNSHVLVYHIPLLSHLLEIAPSTLQKVYWFSIIANNPYITEQYNPLYAPNDQVFFIVHLMIIHYLCTISITTKPYSHVGQNSSNIKKPVNSENGTSMQ